MAMMMMMMMKRKRTLTRMPMMMMMMVMVKRKRRRTLTRMPVMSPMERISPHSHSGPNWPRTTWQYEENDHQWSKWSQLIMIAETINDHRDMISSASLMVVLSMVIRTNLKNLETKSRKSKTCCVPLSCCLVHRRGKETWRHFSFVLFGVRGGLQHTCILTTPSETLGRCDPVAVAWDDRQVVRDERALMMTRLFVMMKRKRWESELNHHKSSPPS